jgi:hypothetical protein
VAISNSHLPAARTGRARRILAVPVALCAAAFITSGPGLAAAAAATRAPAGPSAKWTHPAGIPTAMTNAGSPALASYDGLLYAAWQGKSSPYHIYYSAFDHKTSTWTPEATVPLALTNYRTGPAMAVYNGKLYVAWQGQSSPVHIWYASFNGTSWSHQAEVPSALVHISSTVGLAAYGGDLYLAWTGQSSPYAVWYSAFNGSSWTAQSTVPGTSSDNYQATDTPLAALGGYLWVSWETGADNKLMFNTFNGGTWGTPEPVGVTSDAGPALAVKGDKIYESWINDSTLAVDWTSTTTGLSFTTPKAIPKASIVIELGPALATYDGALYDAWVPDGSPSPVDYSVRS